MDLFENVYNEHKKNDKKMALHVKPPVCEQLSSGIKYRCDVYRARLHGTGFP
jgi:hypothetical protein